MLRFLYRTLWRLLILFLGIGLVWFTLTTVYPYAESFMPSFLVLLLLYCGFVYFAIPLLFRLLRIVVKPDHVPLYVTTGDGWPSDPVNIALIVSGRRHLVRAMTQAGWYVADPLTFRNGFREVMSMILNTAYPAAPLSNLYLFNKSQDIGFEIPTNPEKSARTRHHVRFWRLEEPPVHSDNRTHFAYVFWLQKFQHIFIGKKEMWIGAATEETYPIALQWRTGQLTHGGSDDSDKERDFIIKTLQDSGFVSSTYTSEPGEKLRFRGQQVRTFYVSDGGIKIAKIKETPKKKSAARLP